MALDTTKPYGLVCGEHGIAKFEQDGAFYDAQHNLLDENGMPAKPKASGSTPKVDAPAKPKAEVSEEKALLVERAKELNIKSPHLFGIDTLKEEIAKAEGALNPNDQLSANLGV